MGKKKVYTQEDVIALRKEFINEMKQDAIIKIRRIEKYIKEDKEFAGLDQIEGLNLVLDDIEEVLLNWEED